MTAMRERLVITVLSNDETSSDEELMDYFRENDIPAPVIERAMKARTLFLKGMYQQGAEMLNFRSDRT